MATAAGRAFGSTASRTSRTTSISTALTARMSGTQHPGYLNVTGSQFRLQTSMESVSEFRVNSGLAPAESGLGSGGNITVVTKSGGNRFTGSLFEYKRDDAFDAASKYDNEKQELSLDQFGGSLGGPVVQNRSFFFASFERLRQRTGLRFTEAVPSVEARRRIAAGEPVGSGAGQSGDRTRAVAPFSRVSPKERHQRRIHSSTWRRSIHRRTRRKTPSPFPRRSPVQRLSVDVRSLPDQ